MQQECKMKCHLPCRDQTHRREQWPRNQAPQISQRPPRRRPPSAPFYLCSCRPGQFQLVFHHQPFYLSNFTPLFCPLIRNI